MTVVVFALDPGPRNTGWTLHSSTGQLLEYGFIDGHEVDPFTAFCDQLRRVQRVYGRDNVAVAVEDAVSYGSAKRGLFKLRDLVTKIETWATAKSCVVVRMQRITVLRQLAITSRTPTGLKLTPAQKRQRDKAVKDRCRETMQRILGVELESEHVADAAALGWVVARRLLAQKATQRRSA